MAGNFWHSSHYQQWILDPDDLIRERHEDLAVLSHEEYQKIHVFFANFIQVIGEQLKVRQQVIATATIYFKRFYSRAICLGLSVDLQELFTMYRPIVNGTNVYFPSFKSRMKTKFSHAYTQEFPYRIGQILECEFFLLEAMDCCLIIFHPYRSLQQYVQDVNGEDNLLQLAWRIINDSLRTDVSLLYPPYMISLAAIHMACVINQKDVKNWFAELSVDIEKIIEISRHILALYDLWKNYDEKKEIATLLAKMPKPKLEPSRPPSQGPNGQDSTSGNQQQAQQNP